MPSKALIYLDHQPFRFILVGVCTTLIHFLVLLTLHSQIDLSISISNTVAFLCAVVFSYIMNRNFTFKSRERHSKSAPRFAITTLLGFSWNLALIWLLVTTLGIDYRLAFFLITFVVMVNNYMLTKFWVFADSNTLEQKTY